MTTSKPKPSPVERLHRLCRTIVASVTTLNPPEDEAEIVGKAVSAWLSALDDDPARYLDALANEWRDFTAKRGDSDVA